jgi:hypothetical protein
VHPIYGALLRRPDLLADHVSNYVTLAKEEATSLVRSVVVRSVAGLIAAMAFFLALGLTGVAVMLGAIHRAFVWALVIVPGIAWLIGVIGLLIAMRSSKVQVAQEVKPQVDADLTALRLAGELN